MEVKKKVLLEIVSVFLIILISLGIFSGFHQQFFSADDWFHLKLAQINVSQEFFNFFKFSSTDQQASFYRPIPTQLFFFILQSFFGLEALPYYLIVSSFFILLIILVYLFSKKLTNDSKQSLAITLFYALSHTHFTRLYFLSAFQEIAMAVFVLSSLLFLLKKDQLKYLIFGLLAYCFALMSKETALVMPVLYLLSIIWINITKEGSLKSFLIDLKTKKNTFVLLFIISAVYLYFRFAVFGFDTTANDYQWSMNPLQIISTARWYLLWSLGAPESLVNYMPTPLSVLPRYFLDFPLNAQLSLSLLMGVILITILALFSILIKKSNDIRSIKKLAHYFAIGIFWFISTLGPLLLLPHHLFALELTLPLIGIMLILSILLKHSPKVIGYSLILFFVLTQLVSVAISKHAHYAILRSKISWKVHQFMTQNHADLTDKTLFYFRNDTGDYGEAWGSSKQISQALMGDNYFKVVYKDVDVGVLYEDDLSSSTLEKFILRSNSNDYAIIELDTSQFVYF